MYHSSMRPASPLESAPPAVYRMHWPSEPAVGGLLGAVVGCASGALLAVILSKPDNRRTDAGWACVVAGVIGMGAGSGWRMPGGHE